MKAKAVLLLSGGLDSSLALHLMAKQGLELTVLHFTTLFCTCDKSKNPKSEIRNPKPISDQILSCCDGAQLRNQLTPKGFGCGSNAYSICKELNIPMRTIEMTAEYLPVIRNPKHGYGSGMNPCVDCRLLMFSKAKKIMEEIGASFIITGEVLAQRPMSQMRHTLGLIERESGLQGKILRPLSAQHFTPTDAEKQGLVDRQQLLDFSGRTRKPQIELAEKLGLTEYPCAAGGCLLTDKHFAIRLRDLFKHNIDNLNDIKLLKVGRHFRLSPSIKLIVGRNKADNDQIQRLAMPNDEHFEVLGTGSPIALLRQYNGLSDGVNGYIEIGASICARYSDQKNKPNVKVSHRKFLNEPNEFLEIEVEPITEAKLSIFCL
jgi:tRNA U34 2-thiouridine synthase MnmA/TrmU